MAEQAHWTTLIRQGDLANLRVWLDAGGNVNDREPRNGNTPLEYAANRGQLPAVRLLLERGADAAGSAAFLAAVVGGHGEIARLLLPLTDDAHQLREAADLLAAHGADDELLSLVRQRRKKAKPRKPS